MRLQYIFAAVLGLGIAAAAPAAGAQAPTSLVALRQGPPPARFPQDPADAMYRDARAALNDEEYARAARLFQQIRQRHPRSSYTPDALYWEAFARYRTGRMEELRTALGALDAQRERYPRASTRRDADELATRIRGEMARRGDAQAAQGVTRQAERQAGQCGEDDTRAAALNALLQMDAERALPILRRVLERRDACSAKLREQAVFLVSQKRSPEVEAILMGVARNDPSGQVREQAIFWLGQVGTDRSLEILEEVLRSSTDAGTLDKAVFAVSQHRSPRAAQLLRGLAERGGTPRNVREQAIFWLGQRPSGENAGYLRELYGRLSDAQLREKVIFSLSQMRGVGNERWLMGVAQDASQPQELRKQAIFWVGQTAGSSAELVELYDRVSGREMKEQVIFALSQRGRDRAAVDKLIQIARGDRDRELREKAVFWLGQSSDPRAAEAIADIINQ
jgi:HEAT repeat protein